MTYERKKTESEREFKRESICERKKNICYNGGTMREGGRDS